MPQVPLPRVGLSTTATPQLRAGGVAPQDDRPRQIQQLGAAMSQAGSDAAKIAASINEEHALATMKSGLNEWSEFADQSTLGFQSNIGRDAVEVGGEPGDASNKVAEQIKAKMREVEQGLGSDLAKRMFREYAERGMVRYQGRLSAHEVGQTKAMNHGEDVATGKRFAGSYIANGDPVDFRSALVAWREISDDARQGPEARKAYLLEKKTEMHVGRASWLLEQEMTKEASDYLKGVDAEDIDRTASSKLRAKIKGVLRSEGARKLAIDVFNNHGYRTHADRVQAARATLPKAKLDELAETAVLKIGRDLGIDDRILEMAQHLPGAWKELLSDPRVLARLDDTILSLDEEILTARFPGQPSATDPSTGSYSRGLATLMKLYQDSEIDAEQLQQAQRTLDEQVNRRSREQNVAAQGALLETERIFERNRASGQGPTSVDSAEFRSQHPNLLETLLDHGVLDNARGLTPEPPQRVTDPGWYTKLHVDYDSGALAKMTAAQLWVTYNQRLDETHYREAVRLWSKARNVDPAEAGIKDDPLYKWEDALQEHLGGLQRLTGKRDSSGLRTLDVKKTDEVAYSHSLQKDLREAVKKSGEEWAIDRMKKWVDDRELTLVENDSEGGLVQTMADIAGVGVANRLYQIYQQADSLMARVDGQRIVVSDGAVTAVGEDPLPGRAITFIRDEWRLRQLNDRGQLSDDTFAALIKAGARDENQQTPDYEAIDREFRKHGLGDVWPPVEEQVRQWKHLKKKWPAPLPPADPFTQFGSGHPEIIRHD